MMKFCLLTFLLAASITVLQSATVVYVSENGRNDPSCLNGGESQPCSNLTLVLDHIRSQSNTEVYIKPGQYVLSSNVKLTFEEVENVLLKRNGEGAVNITCEGYMSGLSFINSNNVSIFGIAFVGCGMEHNSTSLIFPIRGSYDFHLFFASLYFESCSNIRLDTISVSDSMGIAVQFYYSPNVSIIDSNFTNNSIGMLHNISGGVYIEFPYCLPGERCLDTNVPIEHVTNSKYIISRCHFADNVARSALDSPNRYIFPVKYFHVAFGHGGGLSVFFKGNSSNSDIAIENCTFTNNEAMYGGGVYIEMQDNSSNNNVIMSGNVFMNNMAQESGGGAYLGFTYEKEYSSVSNCSYSIEDTHFTDNTAIHGGGLYYFTTRQDCVDSQSVNSLELTSCTWTQNKAQSGAGLHLLAFHGINQGIIEPVIIIGGAFVENSIKDFDESDRKGLSFGAILTDKVPIHFKMSAVFNSTIGTSLVTYQSKITFWDDVHVLFFGNSGTFGGAMALYSSTVVVIYKNVTLEFIGNTASSLGGALYVESLGQTSIPNTCFLQYFDFTSSPTKWNASFIFQDNTADGESNSIYISSIGSCLLGRAFGVINEDDIFEVFCWNNETALWEYNNNTTPSSCINQIVTAPSKLMTVYNDSNYLKIIPGKKTNMSISAKDDQGQDVTSNLVLHATSSAPQQVSVDMDINYISNNEIILYQHNTSVSNATITLDTIGEVAQQVRVKLHVELVDCPPGLTLDSTGKCSCSGDFADRVECFNSKFSSFILRGYWIGEYQYQGGTDIVVGHCRNCKYLRKSEDGRLPLGENFAEVEELLCGPYQTGVLCSGCTEGYAPAINTDEFHCVKCDDKRIIRGIVVFILLDIILPFVLLVVIFLSDVPLTSGLLHGPILFGQMITTVVSLDGDGIITYESIFHQGATQRAEKAYSAFYDLFNAEFLMPLQQNYCVSKDIPYAGIIALQYLSAYLPIVFVAIVFYCRNAQFNFPIRLNCRKPSCLKKFSWASYFKNSPNALDTFILLSYTKIAVITGYLLTPASLWTANDSTSFNGRQVMYLDGTIDYSLTHGTYTLYFLLSLLLGVPFLVIVPLFLFCFRAHDPDNNGGFSNYLLHQFQKEFCESLNDFTTTDKIEVVQVNEICPDNCNYYEKDRHHLGQCCDVRCIISNKSGNWLCSYQQKAKKHCKLSFYTEWSRHDFRWLAGGFFILRLLLILPYMLAWNIIIQYILQFTVCMIGGVAIIALRPYKRKEHKYIDPNAIEAGSLLLLALLIALSMYQYTYTTTGIPLSKWAYVLQNVLVWIPLLWFAVIYIRLIYKRYEAKIKKCCGKRKWYQSGKKTVPEDINGELHESLSLIH